MLINRIDRLRGDETLWSLVLKQSSFLGLMILLYVQGVYSVVCTGCIFCCMYRVYILLYVQGVYFVVCTGCIFCCMYRVYILLFVQGVYFVVCTGCILYDVEMLHKHQFSDSVCWEFC